MIPPRTNSPPIEVSTRLIVKQNVWDWAIFNVQMYTHGKFARCVSLITIIRYVQNNFRAMEIKALKGYHPDIKNRLRLHLIERDEP
jgi:hypothetical protein